MDANNRPGSAGDFADCTAVPSTCETQFDTQSAIATSQPDATGRKLRHRMMNLLSVIQAIIRLSARDAEDVAAYSDALASRVNTLAIAHGSGMSPGKDGSVAFRDLVKLILPRRPPDDGQLLLEGPDFEIPERAITSLAMILHELSANALVNGAWAQPGGQVRAAWTLEQDRRTERLIVRFDWTETGHKMRPLPDPTPTSQSRFETLLINSSIDQLDGRIIQTRTPVCVQKFLEFLV